MGHMITYMEVTGWNREGESVEDSDSPRDGETEQQLLGRMQIRSGIIEIGDVRVSERREL